VLTNIYSCLSHYYPINPEVSFHTIKVARYLNAKARCCPFWVSLILYLNQQTLLILFNQENGAKY
ncbi:hypothetical protein, partial [Prevotella sp.]